MDTRKGRDYIKSKLIKDKIMIDKLCGFQLENITAGTVEKETPSGTENIDVKLFKPVADHIDWSHIDFFI